MSEYTPTTEEVRNGFSRSRQMPQFQSPALQSDFDRWLAAHDAEVRAVERERAALHAEEGYRYEENCDDIAKRIRSGEPAEISARPGVVAEEPEWEIGVSYSTPSGPSIDGYRIRSYMKVESVEKAREFAALVERPMIQKRTKAVPAGEWVRVPVDQEHESGGEDNA